MLFSKIQVFIQLQKLILSRNFLQILLNMRSTFSSSNNLAHSKISAFGSTSFIRTGTNFTVNVAKCLIADQIGPDYQKILGNQLTEKDLADIKRVGYSFKKYQNGDTYVGQIDNNQKPQGQGYYRFNSSLENNKYFYKGGFENGQFSGYGKLYKMISEKQAMYVYQGHWKYGRKEGEGRENYNLQNTSYYKGGFSNDQRHGVGTMVMPEGSYQGKWQNGLMNGEGTLTIQKGPLKIAFNGIWINQSINQGTISYYAKSSNQLIGTYKGQIKDLCRNGQGQYRVGNAIIQGQFFNDEIVGASTLRKVEPLSQFLLQGDMNQMKDYNATIKYLNTNDHYQGKVQIAPNNIVLRTVGKYYTGTGQVIQGEFADNSQGNIILKNK